MSNLHGKREPASRFKLAPMADPIWTILRGFVPDSQGGPYPGGVLLRA